MLTDNKSIQLITKLLRETAAGDIKWVLSYPPKSLISATEDEIHSYFQVNYKDRIIAIFERRSRYYYDEHAFYWTSQTSFAILDNFENLIWEFTQSAPILEELFKVVRLQVADIDSLLDNLLF